MGVVEYAQVQTEELLQWKQEYRMRCFTEEVRDRKLDGESAGGRGTNGILYSEGDANVEGQRDRHEQGATQQTARNQRETSSV